MVREKARQGNAEQGKAIIIIININYHKNECKILYNSLDSKNTKIP